MKHKIETLKELVSVIECTVSFFKLNHMQINIRKASTPPEDEDLSRGRISAQHHTPHGGYLTHSLTFFPYFFEMDYDEQMITVAHEFGHIIFTRLRETLDFDRLEDFVPPLMRHQLNDQAQFEEEALCDHLAHFIYTPLIEYVESKLGNIFGFEDEEDEYEEEIKTEAPDNGEDEAGANTVVREESSSSHADEAEVTDGNNVSNEDSVQRET